MGYLGKNQTCLRLFSCISFCVHPGQTSPSQSFASTVAVQLCEWFQDQDQILPLVLTTVIGAVLTQRTFHVGACHCSLKVTSCLEKRSEEGKRLCVIGTSIWYILMTQHVSELSHTCCNQANAKYITRT